MTLAEYWMPYLISQIVFLFLLFASLRWFALGRLLWIIIFLAAAIFNFCTASTQPEAYVMYAEGALLPFYKNFILGDFARHPGFYVKPIAVGQIFVGLLLTGRTRLFKLGCFGGVVFLVAITPLGVGAALPATLFGAMALALLWRRGTEQTIFHILRRKKP
ncbi:hypothetical protein JXA70_04955 [candidate division KSB1 bacterium]|nr:hypothetical protein [candidate division KSB1 bacterium]